MPRDRIDIFLDGAGEPLLSTTPPLSFELDTSRMEDGPHVMRIEAYDSRRREGRPHGRLQRPQRSRDRRLGNPAERRPRRQDPGHRQRLWRHVRRRLGTVSGRDAGAAADLGLGSADSRDAFGLFYGMQQWSPTTDFARTPTYGTFTAIDQSRRSGGRRRACRRTRPTAPADAPVKGEAGAGRPPAIDAGSGRPGRRALLRQLRRLPPGRPARAWRACSRRWPAIRSSTLPIRRHTSRRSSTASRARRSTASPTPRRCRLQGHPERRRHRRHREP